MTTFSAEQLAIFNQMRCKSEDRKRIADAIAEQRMEIEKRQANVRNAASKIAKDQAKLSREQAVIAKEQAKIAREQQKIEKVQAEIAEEQTEIAKEQEEIVKEQIEIAKEQEEIQEIDGAIVELSTVDAGLQRDVTGLLDRLDEGGAVKPVLLQFNPDGKTIHWAGGSVTLTEKRCTIVEALYLASKRRMSITKLEEKAWGATKIPSTNTVRVTLHKLNVALKKANCPYRVIRIKHKAKTVPVENPITKNLYVATVQPKIEMYKLVCRKF